MDVDIHAHSVTFCFHKIDNDDEIFLKARPGGNTHKQ